MDVTLEFRDWTPTHCDVAVFVNHALSGTLRLRQEELAGFTCIFARGHDPDGAFSARITIPTDPKLVKMLQEVLDDASAAGESHDD